MTTTARQRNRTYEVWYMGILILTGMNVKDQANTHRHVLMFAAHNANWNIRLCACTRIWLYTLSCSPTRCSRVPQSAYDIIEIVCDIFIGECVCAPTRELVWSAWDQHYCACECICVLDIWLNNFIGIVRMRTPSPKRETWLWKYLCIYLSTNAIQQCWSTVAHAPTRTTRAHIAHDDATTRRLARCCQCRVGNNKTEIYWYTSIMQSLPVICVHRIRANLLPGACCQCSIAQIIFQWNMENIFRLYCYTSILLCAA